MCAVDTRIIAKVLPVGAAASSANSAEQTNKCQLQGSDGHPVVIFRTEASYHPLFWLATLVPASILWCIWNVIKDEANHFHGQKEYVSIVISLWISFTFIMGCLLLLPYKYEVLSDGSVCVGTFVGKKWRFDSVRAAYDHQQYFSFQRGCHVLRFAGASRCVLVKRRSGCCDLLVSPKNPADFVGAVWKAVLHQDAQTVDASPSKLAEDQFVGRV